MTSPPVYLGVVVAYVSLGVILSSSPVFAEFKYERNIAFTLERVNSLGLSSESRDVGGFDQNSRAVYLNIGNAFDVTSGRFTVPLDGVYAFYFSFSSTMMGATTSLELLKVASGQSDRKAVSLVKQTLVPSIVNPLDFASASVIAQLNRNDAVLMRLGPGLLDASRDRPLLYTGYMVYRLRDQDMNNAG